MLETLLFGLNLWIWLQIFGCTLVAIGMFLFARKINKLASKVFDK